MKTNQSAPESIDEYIGRYSPDVQRILQKVRLAIRKAAPEAEETIKYQLPTFTLNGNLVHFGAFKNHVGFYPTPSAIRKFAPELSVYEGAKGSVRFPLDRPMPLDLIGRIVRYRVAESMQGGRAEGKSGESQASESGN